MVIAEIDADGIAGEHDQIPRHERLFTGFVLGRPSPRHGRHHAGSGIEGVPIWGGLDIASDVAAHGIRVALVEIDRLQDRTVVDRLQRDGDRYPTTLVVLPAEKTRTAIGPVSIAKLRQHVEFKSAVGTLRRRLRIVERNPEVELTRRDSLA